MSKDLASVKQYIVENHSQSHLCICNTDLFEGSIRNGICGFPHNGSSKTKSFWRAVASMYNIGPYDLVFLYRTSGKEKGCREIHGPFKIKSIDGSPAIYYDPVSSRYPMNIPGKKGGDCRVRFLYEKLSDTCRSISHNFELIKRYESKEIWGYRHPAVMNIGAARKKSVTSFTCKQTLVLLDLIRKFGCNRYEIRSSIPLNIHLEYYSLLKNTNTSYKLDDKFLRCSRTNDEAFLYAYLLSGLKNRNSSISSNLIRDFAEISSKIMDTPFEEISVNAMMEVIISPHLQDELDIVLMNKDDSEMLCLEFKDGIIGQSAVNKTIEYLDLLSVIFPNRKIYANLIGSGKDCDVVVPFDFSDRLCIVSFAKTTDGYIRFEKS